HGRPVHQDYHMIPFVAEWVTPAFDRVGQLGGKPTAAGVHRQGAGSFGVFAVEPLGIQTSQSVWFYRIAELPGRLEQLFGLFTGKRRRRAPAKRLRDLARLSPRAAFEILDDIAGGAALGGLEQFVKGVGIVPISRGFAGEN